MTIAVDLSTPVRCSAWTLTQALDPIGSIGSYHGYLLVEQPLPWPRDVSEIPELAAVSPLLADGSIRTQALVPTGDEPRVILYRTKDRDLFSGYTRQEVPRGGDLTAAVARLLNGEGITSDSAGAPPVRDLLICTHGRRDVCCGSNGTKLATELAGSTEALPDGVNLWRTSHTGGHRFAPTFLFLPEGTAWAHADAELISQVTRRQGPVEDVLANYRGCSGLDSRPVQVLEREVLRRVGWSLLDRPRTGVELGDGRVQLTVREPEERWEATVRVGRSIPMPDCGATPESARKTESEYTITDVRRVD